MSKILEKRIEQLESSNGTNLHFCIEDKSLNEFVIDGVSLTEEEYRKRIEAFPENTVRKIIIAE